jgi:hypothetical protein
VFVCESCADVHVCRPNVPCEIAVLNSDRLPVCPASGFFTRDVFDVPRIEDADEAAAARDWNDWDPDLSASQQHGRWFEQGYFMTDEQAEDFFGDRRRRMACRTCR